MRAFVQRPLAFALVGFAGVLSGRALAQSVEEVTVREQKSSSEYRRELEQAREELIQIYNEENSGEDNDITCRNERQTGTRTTQRVCRSNGQSRAEADAAHGFLESLLLGSGDAPGGGAQVNAAIGTAVAQSEGVAGGEESRASVDEELQRLQRENQRLYQAAAKYVELEDEYNRARGQLEPTTTLVTEQALKIPIEARALSNAQCAATTTTEYLQRNTIARVNSILKIEDCAAASGAFTVAVRVRDESGEDKSLEFDETWQRSDDQDVKFAADYPIGENTELISVRVRRLSCTCADPAQEDPVDQEVPQIQGN